MHIFASSSSSSFFFFFFELSTFILNIVHNIFLFNLSLILFKIFGGIFLLLLLLFCITHLKGHDFPHAFISLRRFQSLMYFCPNKNKNSRTLFLYAKFFMCAVNCACVNVVRFICMHFDEGAGILGVP